MTVGVGSALTDDLYIAHYFVDEAGDLSLFDAKGRPLRGTNGVSRTFMVGAGRLMEPHPERVEIALRELRETLLADSYFRGIHSMDAARGKTAASFHAKNDHAEIRREVFRYIATLPLTMYVAIRRKECLEREAKARFAATAKRLDEGAIYDDLVVKVFQDRLYKGDENHIVFARRGKSARNIALEQAIGLAKAGSDARWQREMDRPTAVRSSTPSESPCLQVVDYCLWALQRFVERDEERFFNYIADKFRLVLDCDDTREQHFGRFYGASYPLCREKLMPVL